MREKRIAICGANDEAVEYALGMLLYSACVMIATNGKKSQWSKQHARWLKEYEIPVTRERITNVKHRGCQILGLELKGGERIKMDYLFTSRGRRFSHETGEEAARET